MRFISQSRCPLVRNRLGTSPLETRLSLTPRGGPRMKASASESSVMTAHAHPPHQLPSPKHSTRHRLSPEILIRIVLFIVPGEVSEISYCFSKLTHVCRYRRPTLVNYPRVSLDRQAMPELRRDVSPKKPRSTPRREGNRVGFVTDPWRLQLR